MKFKKEKSKIKKNQIWFIIIFIIVIYFPLLNIFNYYKDVETYIEIIIIFTLLYYLYIKCKYAKIILMVRSILAILSILYEVYGMFKLLDNMISINILRYVEYCVNRDIIIFLIINMVIVILLFQYNCKKSSRGLCRE